MEQNTIIAQKLNLHAYLIKYACLFNLTCKKTPTLSKKINMHAYIQGWPKKIAPLDKVP